MRALVMTAPGGAENSQIQEIAAPHPGPGRVAIDVAYAGLNFVDVMTRRGDAAYAADWPYLPGKEVSGTVRALGAGVTGLAVGDRVVAAPVGAGLAEVVVAEAALTVPLPDGVALREAAAVPLGLATSVLLLTDAGRFTAGDTVLVHSAGGGIGNAVARLVPLLGGGRLIGTVGRPEKARRRSPPATTTPSPVPTKRPRRFAPPPAAGASTWCSTRWAPRRSTSTSPWRRPARGSCCSATRAAAPSPTCPRSAV